MQKEKGYVEIDLLHILQVLVQKIWALILAAIIFGGSAFAISQFAIKPKYQASVMLYVNNSSFSVGNTNFSISSSELTAAQSLVDTYIVILKTRSTLSEVIKEGNLSYSYESLKEMISASAENGTEIFKVTVTSHSPEEAKAIANTIAKVLPNKVENIVDGASMRVVDYAVTPNQKSEPSVTKYTAIGMLLGIVIAAALIIIQDFMDDMIHDAEYLRETYPEIPLLSNIPDIDDEPEDMEGGYSYGRKK